ncbi:reverse transcriptase domain-containing protein [Tanacetum coccineum]
MNAMANVTPIIATVKNIGVKEKTLKEADVVPMASILDFYEKHYEDILPIIMDKACPDKQKEVPIMRDPEMLVKERHDDKTCLTPDPRCKEEKAAPVTEDTGSQRRKRHKPADEEDLAVERWTMPTWCHMFNSTLIGATRVGFDELPPESIDGYKGLKAAFLAYFMHQKKYVKDPVEIYNIKQRDGETIEEFIERFKIETKRMKGAP